MDPRQAGLGEVIASSNYKAGKADSIYQDDCVQDIIRRGTAEALPRIRNLIEAEPGKVHFEEDVLNWLGYHFFY